MSYFELYIILSLYALLSSEYTELGDSASVRCVLYVIIVFSSCLLVNLLYIVNCWIYVLLVIMTILFLQHLNVYVMWLLADLQYLIICCINFSAVHDIYSKCMHVFCVDICIVLCDIVLACILFGINWIVC